MIRNRTLLGVTAALTFLIATPVPAATLGELGARFEGAHEIAPLESAWSAMMDEGIDKELRGAANLLGAAIALEAGDHAAVLARADRARKGDEADRDDADFLVCIAGEASGSPVQHVEAWREWLEHHESSPLRPEAQLRLLWAHLRAGDLEAATRLRDRMTEEGRTILQSTRFVEAEATRRLAVGQAEGALEILANAEASTRVLYLRGLAHAAAGRPLDAAASLQRVALGTPGTPLGDHAALAKANIFFSTGAYRTAGEEFAAAARQAVDPGVRDEASLRRAVCTYLDGDVEGASALLRDVAVNASRAGVRARAQFLLGESMLDQERYADAIVEFNEVLTRYFDQSIAASAQYRVGRALDALGRHGDATGAYQAVVKGHPLEPEAPAAAYLAGAGLLAAGRASDAAPYFQIVVDRYTANDDGDGTIVFRSQEHRELTEAALCLLIVSYHRAGDLGQLSGVPHLMLERMPPSTSPWRAWALLLDADALAAMGRHDEARARLASLFADFPDHAVAAPATQLLAWSYAETGETDLALQTEQRLLDEYAHVTRPEQKASARLHSAHAHFNRREYETAATLYEAVLADPAGGERETALHQVALCYVRLNRDGDAVDRWTTLVDESPTHPLAEQAWMRAGDVYFDAAHYEEAERLHQGLLDHFPESASAPAAMLRLAQSAYNSGNDTVAVERYSALIERFPGSAEAGSAENGIQTALLRLGEAEGGTEALAALIERYPNGSFAAEAQMRIAEGLAAEGRFEEAAEEFRRVVSRHPGHPSADRAQYLAADAYSQLGDEGRARAALEQMLVFFPDSELQRNANFQLGNLFFAEGDLLRAAVQFTQVVDVEVEDEVRSAAWFNLALCEVELGRHAEAIARLNGYRDTYGDDARGFDVCMQLGSLYLTAADPASAEDEFDRARSFTAAKDRQAELWYRIAEAREGAGELESAIKAYGMAAGQGEAGDAFRLAAVGRMAAHHEEREDWAAARRAWLDLGRNSPDTELAAAANARAAELQPFAR